MKDTLTIEIRSRSAQPWFNQMWVPNRNSVADGYSKRIGTINQIGEFSLFFYFFCWICCIFFCSFVNGYFCAIFKCLFVYFTKLLTLFFPWIIHKSFFFCFLCLFFKCPLGYGSMDNSRLMFHFFTIICPKIR